MSTPITRYWVWVYGPASVARVMDGATPIHSISLTPDKRADGEASYYGSIEEAEAELETWLDANFPQWRDPNAYR